MVGMTLDKDRMREYQRGRRDLLRSGVRDEIDSRFEELECRVGLLEDIIMEGYNEEEES